MVRITKLLGSASFDFKESVIDTEIEKELATPDKRSLQQKFWEDVKKGNVIDVKCALKMGWIYMRRILKVNALLI